MCSFRYAAMRCHLVKKGLPLMIEVVSILLSVYGFGTAAYWYWVYLRSPAVIQYQGQIVMQGVPLEHIIGSLFTTALGGLVHTVGTLFEEHIQAFERQVRALLKL